MYTFPSSSRLGSCPLSNANGQLRSSFPACKPFFGLPLGFGRPTLVRSRRKRRKQGKFPINPHNRADGKRGMLSFACSQYKDEPGLPPFHRFTSRWISAQSKLPFLPLSLVVNKLQLHPVNLSRLAVCWCNSRVRSGSRAVISATRDFLYERSILVLRGVAFVGSVLLMGLLSLYVQGKLQSHLEKHVLPPVANVVGAYLGRTVSFGRVQSVSPLGLTLESCYIGPHDDEFSCGELPFVEIRVRPFTSIQRGQIVLDAVLIDPNVLVCQKRDWSWLGIAASNGRSSLRTIADEGIDTRTKSRRSSREQVVSRIAQERDDAAKKSAESGYVLHGEERQDEIMKTSQIVDVNERNLISSESFAEASNMYNVQKKTSDLDKACSEVSRMDDEHRNSSEEGPMNAMIGLNRSFRNCKMWFEMHFGKPVPLFKHWNRKSLMNRFEIQRRNLDVSAAAARAYFDSFNHDDGSSDLDEASEIYSGALNKSDIEDKSMHYSASMFNESDDINTVVENMHGSLNNAVEQVSLEFERRNIEAGPEDAALDLQTNNITLKGKQIQTNVHDEEKINQLQIHNEGLEGIGTFAKGFWRNGSERNKLLDHIAIKGHSLTASQSHHEFQKDRTDNISSELYPYMIIDGSSRYGFVKKMQQAKQWWEKILLPGVVNKHKKESPASYMTEEIEDDLVPQGKSNIDARSLRNWVPATIDSIYIRGGTVMLLAYGDVEPRIMESVNGYLRLRNKYEQIDVHVIGKLQQWRVNTINGNGGKLLVKVFADMQQHKWHVKLKGSNLYAPLVERLLEIPLNWADGRASGELSIWASKGDVFPNMAGRLNVSKLAFHIWETPSAFKDVCGTLFIQGQRLFLHNTTGYFGAIPLHVSGDMDLNPDGGEYRLVCQVPNVEANALMKTLKARPPLFSLAGAVKAAVYCRGPLEAPVFAGSAEISKKNVETALDRPSSSATEAIRKNEHKGAIAAFDRIPFSYASTNFTFDTDNCVADVYGIRVTLVDGGELRGAGNLWICPEGELDPSAVNMDLSGQMFFDSVVQNYLPENFQSTPIKLEYVHGEAKIHGSLMQPIFDIKWNAPDAKGAFSGVRGDINISHEAIAINSSAFTFDLSAKIHTAYPSQHCKFIDLQPSPPKIEGLDFDLKMRGFDFLGLISPNMPGIPLSVTSEGIHAKLTGRAKFQGRVVTDERLEKIPKNRPESVDTKSGEVSGVLGEILLSGLKLNQFLVAPHLSGNMEIFPTRFKLNTVGRADEHLIVGFSGYGNSDVLEQKVATTEISKKTIFFSLERGQLQMKMDYQPGQFAKLEVRNLQLDELEVASLRGAVQKVEAQLNFQKRKGQGMLSVRRPRFSGVQGESLDLSFRWSGDVITLERSVLEQASSRYELQGEYVLPGPRDRVFAEERAGNTKTAMAGQFGSFITSLGRWRLQLEVPGAEVTDLLPVARLLSRSSDPAVVSRSKELFMQGMQMAGFYTENIKQQIENVQHRKISLPSLEEGSAESIPLPGLAELKGHWHGTFDASGGGNGDTSADFDFHGEEWEWGTYKIQRVISSGSYNNNEGLHLDKIFIQKDAATLHADGTLLGPKSNLHFAVLNLPVGLVPPLLHAIQSSTLQSVPYETARTPITSVRGILYMEGDLRGPLVKPQCDVQVRLLDGIVGGVELGRAEVVASVTSSNRFNFNAKFEPSGRNGHVYVRGSLPVEARGLDAIEDDEEKKETRNMKRSRNWTRNKSKASEENDAEEKKLVWDRLGDEGWEIHFAESLKELDWDLSEKGAVQMDAVVKDGGMMLITALSPQLHWLQGNADLTLQVRGTTEQPTVDGVASFHRVSISSPVLPRPVSNVGGTIRVINNQLRVEGLEGRVGRKGRLHVKGKLPLRSNEAPLRDSIELKTDFLEVRAKNMFSGQVDTQMRFTGSILEPEVSGIIKLSHGEAYLPQEKGLNTAASTLASSLTGITTGGKLTGFPRNDATSLPDQLWEPQTVNGNEDKVEEIREQRKSLVAVGLRNLKLVLGPELRVVYPLILNFAVTGEIELNGLADPQWIKPKGTLTFENGDVNLVATQVRLNRDHPNRAKFEPEQGLDPTLDLALVGADWQLKVQGRARNWQDNLVITSTKSGEPDAFTRTEAARVFESQLADSLLEGNGQLAFKKLAAATVETLMPKIEGKGEFGQARWRLVSAPQIPNLLSLDPTTDPFKSLANLSFGTEVEVQLGKRLQASVVRQLKESEMATQWTLIYHLSNKLRILFSSIPSVDNRLLFEYSATSQN